MMQKLVFILLLSLSALQLGTAESNLRVVSSSTFEASNQQRRLNWFTNLLYALHIPPPSKHHESTSGSSEGGGEDTQTQSASDTTEVSAATSASYGDGDDGSDVSYSDYEASENYFTNNSGSDAELGGSKAGVGIFLFVAAAMIAGVVGAAMLAAKVSGRIHTMPLLSCTIMLIVCFAHMICFFVLVH